MKKEVTELVKKMYDLGIDIEDCIFSLQTAFIYNSSTPLKDCAARTANISSSEGYLTSRIAELAKENPEIAPYISIPGHMLKISESVENLSGLIQKKIKENMLFSDRVAMETCFLLQRLIDMATPMADVILARNRILSYYVQESQKGVMRRAIEYSTFHEERLIEGFQHPASLLYIKTLDAIKAIAWHSKEIAMKLTEGVIEKLSHIHNVSE
ncbi:MAG: hypothetical protein CVV37_07445 [Nitrospira bacterium HGW-Nitrospira-1]|nr:MAG: hypothetical protein CVV37_07445 [Nitrospira bacterium HGW-Nitrospira-1]